MQRRMIDTLGAIPGVTAVGLVDRLPLGMEWDNAGRLQTRRRIRCMPPPSHRSQYSRYLLDIYSCRHGPVVGEKLTWHDDFHAPRVAIVNREFAHRLFGSEKGAWADTSR